MTATECFFVGVVAAATAAVSDTLIQTIMIRERWKMARSMFRGQMVGIVWADINAEQVTRS